MIRSLLVTAGLAASLAASAPDPAVGRRIYLEGINSAGRPVHATVQGDVEVLGTRFACVSCHLRSGMGSSEGARLAPPVSGLELFRPGRTPAGPRPAHTEESVVRAVVRGIGAMDRPLDPLMPRYALTPEDAHSLVAYLKTLSAAPSPGVTETAISFAVVVDEGVDPADRKSMLDVLEGFVRQKNVQTRQQRRRGDAAAGRNFERPMYASFREWRLVVWTLRGPEDTRREQLESLYAREPVFGLLSGMLEGSWRPIHEFCEENAIPCLLPNTDRPSIDAPGYYTRYYSGGLDLEARAVAAHLATGQPATRIAQVFRDDPDGRAAAASFRRALEARKLPAPINVPLPASAKSVGERLDEAGVEVVTAWLPRGDLLPELRLGDRPRRIYLSSTLLGGPLSAAQGERLGHAILVNPFAPPSELPGRLGRLEAWLSSAKIPAGNLRIQDQTLFACMMAGEALMQIRTGFYRDWFLERFDHGGGGGGLSAFYPRLSFGPGQTVLSKGCFLVPLGSAGAAPAEWVVP